MKININSITNAKDFVNICGKSPCDVSVKSGRYIIDAKSIMGIFSLDLSKDLEVFVEKGTEKDITRTYKSLEKFEV